MIAASDCSRQNFPGPHYPETERALWGSVRFVHVGTFRPGRCWRITHPIEPRKIEDGTICSERPYHQQYCFEMLAVYLTGLLLH